MATNGTRTPGRAMTPAQQKSLEELKAWLVEISSPFTPHTLSLDILKYYYNIYINNNICTISIPLVDSNLKKSRPKKIPKDFTVTDDMEKWFDEMNFQTIQLTEETERFVDYWLANGKRKKNWVATWRNWMRNSEKYNLPKDDWKIT